MDNLYNNQGRRKDQIEFSEKVAFYSICLIIITAVVFELLNLI